MTSYDEAPPPAVVRRRVVVSGRVQGVWFRESCRQQARGEHLAGSVRNLDDGTVEAIFEGPPASVERLVEWCRTGPRHADVRSVATFDCEPVGETTFEVR
jgi:acylphosphatase